MGLYLRYGSYTHDENSCTVSIDKQVVENEAGHAYLTRQTWNVSGQLQGDTPAAVVAQMVLLERAYAKWGGDLSLIDESGNVYHSLPNGPSVTGVRIVKPPSYPDGEGAQLSTFRDFTLVATADYPFSAAGGIWSWSESVTFSGGGPQRAVVELVNGPPQEQILKTFTAYRATQQGRAVGMFAYPLVPAPLFPAKLESDPTITRESPKVVNGKLSMFPISWSYSYISATPLVGLPTPFPV